LLEALLRGKTPITALYDKIHTSRPGSLKHGFESSCSFSTQQRRVIEGNRWSNKVTGLIVDGAINTLFVDNEPKTIDLVNGVKARIKGSKGFLLCLGNSSGGLGFYRFRLSRLRLDVDRIWRRVNRNLRSLCFSINEDRRRNVMATGWELEGWSS
jgi:hypothetical protein